MTKGIGCVGVRYLNGMHHMVSVITMGFTMGKKTTMGRECTMGRGSTMAA